MPEKETETTAAAAPGDKKKETTTTSTTPGVGVRKAKSFKRIRGFLTGESRKERRARKQAEAAAKKSSPLQKAKDNILEGADKKSKKTTTLDNVATALDTDDSTIYGVQVDERSTSTNSLLQGGERGGGANLLSTSLEDAAAEKAASEKSSYLLKLVLLLMDPETRRFELLQLEFDSNKALVADVLAQIPLSVTEEALRQQAYTGVTSRDGKEMTSDKLLSDFCQGNDVLVAVGEGVPAKECARLAKPILSDEKVISMLTSSGIDPKVWKEKKKAKSASTKAAPKESSSSKSAPNKSSSTATTSSSAGPSKLNIFLVLFFLTAGLRIVHMFFSAPIQPGHVVSPGITLRQCGIFGLVPAGLSKALVGPRVCVDNARMQISSDKVSMYDGDDNLVWILHGNPCPTDSSQDDDNCVDGLEFKSDRSLAMGGKSVKWLETFVSTTKLAPWPFAEEPVVKTWRGTSHKA